MADLRQQVDALINELEKDLTTTQEILGRIPREKYPHTWARLRVQEDTLINVLYTIHYYTDKEAADGRDKA